MEAGLSNLKQYYDYWDKYVANWYRCRCPCCTYLPEPWWGWQPNSNKPIHSVVLNLNPGKGGKEQTREFLTNILSNHSYSEAIFNKEFVKHLPKTHCWHNNFRAKPILSNLSDYKQSNSEFIDHHLSIELSPLHSVTSLEVEDYVAEHANETLAYSLRFAADASRYITGLLHGIVIVRCSANRFLNILSKLGVNRLGINRINGNEESPYWSKIDLPGFADVKFVCVWGERNHIPQKDIMKITSKKQTTKQNL